MPLEIVDCMKGYSSCTKEFSEALRKITLMGYGIVCIAHSETRTLTADDGSDYEVIAPALGKRAYGIINQLVDIIGYIGSDKAGNRSIYTRATPNIVAGSRYPYMAPVIPFGYEALANALADAVEATAAHGGAVVDDPIQRFKEVETRPFEDTMSETRSVFEQLLKKGDETMDKVVSIISEVFGNPDFHLSEATKDQQELVEEVLRQMKTLL